jgi:hypothetical protein
VPPWGSLDRGGQGAEFAQQTTLTCHNDLGGGQKRQDARHGARAWFMLPHADVMELMMWNPGPHR